MPEFVLSARTALNQDRPLVERWNGLAIAEIEGENVWWLSVPRGGEGAFAAAIATGLGMDMPGQGRFSKADAAEPAARLLFAGDRQWFLTGAIAALPEAVAGAAAATDQSDGWVGLTMEGGMAREALIRLVGIDVHPASFPAGSAARTPFEGMLALLSCEDAEAARYRILFQRSSARSFVDHLRHAATSVCGQPLTGAGH